MDAICLNCHKIEIGVPNSMILRYRALEHCSQAMTPHHRMTGLLASPELRKAVGSELRGHP